MGYSLRQIPFFSDEIEMTEIESATTVEAFSLEGQPIRKAIGEQRASLEEFDDAKGHYLLTLQNGDFIEFREKVVSC